MPTLFTLTCTQVPRFLQLYLKKIRLLRWNRCVAIVVWCSTQCVRDLEILKLQLFVFHNTDTISFPVFNSRFLRFNKQLFQWGRTPFRPNGLIVVQEAITPRAACFKTMSRHECAKSLIRKDTFLRETYSTTRLRFLSSSRCAARGGGSYPVHGFLSLTVMSGSHNNIALVMTRRHISDISVRQSTVTLVDNSKPVDFYQTMYSTYFTR